MKSDKSRDDKKPVKYLNLKKVRGFFISNPSIRQLQYWASKGLKARNKAGTRIILQCVREGGDIFTTAQWVEEFRAAMQADLIRTAK